MRDLGKLIVAKGFKKLPNMVTLGACIARVVTHYLDSDFRYTAPRPMSLRLAGSKHTFLL